MAISGDYLGLESHLKARLTALADSVPVHSLASLGDVKSRLHLAPAVFVGFAGDERSQDVADTLQQWTQRWWTVIAVKYAGGRSAEALRNRAGPLLMNVINQLGGWTPDRSQWQPLRRSAASQPQYFIGYAEFPLQWETRVTIPIQPPE